MKKIVFLFLFAINVSSLFSQTLFTYGLNTVSKDEFLRAYNKNKTVVDDKEKALREYLDLYTKFKLKVKAAQDIRLDTLPMLTNDLQNFKSQIDESYMANENALNQLVDEAFVHAQKDVHVIHFFTPLNATTTPEDAEKAKKAMQEVYGYLQAGKKDYEQLATSISAKYIKVNTADIGYITAFSIPYEYEKIIYSLKNGEVNKPYQSKKGLHIFKIVGSRSGVGKWRVAQILFAIPPGNEVQNKKIIQQKADSIYLQLQAGADFADMAKRFSDDKLTYLAGGNLPEFTTGRYDPSFEDAVYKLVKDGEISKPFLTPFGFHIVKRLAVQVVETNKNNAAYMYDIKQRVTQDSRVSLAKDIFTKSVIQQVAYKKNTAVKDADLFRFADSVVANPALNGERQFPISNKIIYSTDKSKITGADWLHLIREYKTNPELYKGESNAALLEKLVTLKSIEYYKAHLEEFNPEFKYQVEEFKEGNMLFEIMERKVWSSAVNDSAGLITYYNQHKSKYTWAESAEVIIFSCPTKKSAEDAAAALVAGKYWKKIADESGNTIQADSGRYELAQIALPANTRATQNMITPITVNTADGTAGFVKILNIHPANQQRSFDEARGLVINDYQNVLEEKWMEELRKKYPIKIDERVFDSLLK
jgi:peptidyl-prolyl cis-trans isomerase SurA